MNSFSDPSSARSRRATTSVNSIRTTSLLESVRESAVQDTSSSLTLLGRVPGYAPAAQRRASPLFGMLTVLLGLQLGRTLLQVV